MIVVKVELHGACAGRVTEIGRMLIGNTGGTHKRGNYEVQVLRRSDVDRGPVDRSESFDLWGRASTTRTGAVTSYPRLSYNVWRLVARALLSAFPEEDHSGTTPRKGKRP